MLERMCPDAYVTSFILDTRSKNYSDCFEHHNKPEVEKTRLNQAQGWVNWIENGHVLMLSYNYPVNQHWVAVLVWKSQDKYNIQVRNSMPGQEDVDKKVISCGKNLIKKLYNYVTPNWKHVIATVDPPIVASQNKVDIQWFVFVRRWQLTHVAHCNHVYIVP